MFPLIFFSQLFSKKPCLENLTASNPLRCRQLPVPCTLQTFHFQNFLGRPKRNPGLEEKLTRLSAPGGRAGSLSCAWWHCESCWRGTGPLRVQCSLPPQPSASQHGRLLPNPSPRPAGFPATGHKVSYQKPTRARTDGAQSCFTKDIAADLKTKCLHFP